MAGCWSAMRWPMLQHPKTVFLSLKLRISSPLMTRYWMTSTSTICHPPGASRLCCGPECAAICPATSQTARQMGSVSSTTTTSSSSMQPKKGTSWTTLTICVINYYHKQFKHAAKKRYFLDDTDYLYFHSYMSDYFLGTYGGGILKPFRYTEIQNTLFI